MILSSQPHQREYLWQPALITKPSNSTLSQTFPVPSHKYPTPAYPHQQKFLYHQHKIFFTLHNQIILLLILKLVNILSVNFWMKSTSHQIKLVTINYRLVSTNLVQVLILDTDNSTNSIKRIFTPIIQEFTIKFYNYQVIQDHQQTMFSNLAI